MWGNEGINKFPYSIRLIEVGECVDRIFLMSTVVSPSLNLRTNTKLNTSSKFVERVVFSEVSE